MPFCSSNQELFTRLVFLLEDICYPHHCEGTGMLPSNVTLHGPSLINTTSKNQKKLSMPRTLPDPTYYSETLLLQVLSDLALRDSQSLVLEKGHQVKKAQTCPASQCY